MAPKLSNLQRFEAWGGGSSFVQIFVHIFALRVGGAGVTRAFLIYTPTRNYYEINSENIIHVTETRFSMKIIPKQFFHVILWITNEYVICNIREIASR